MFRSREPTTSDYPVNYTKVCIQNKNVEKSVEKILESRSNNLGKSLSISYQTPLQDKFYLLVLLPEEQAAYGSYLSSR